MRLHLVFRMVNIPGMKEPNVVTHLLEDDGVIPNHAKLPLLVYPGAVKGESMQGVRQRILANNWHGAWAGSVYSFHHYHSMAHEVLGCFQGSATVQFGGESGPKVEIQAGDGVVIPAGVGHKKISSSADFQVIGAYPAGQEVDMCGEEETSREEIIDRIQGLANPKTDPFYGEDGPLARLWA